MSEAGPMSCRPSACSGDMYSGVPRMSPVKVCARWAARSLARPKSMIFGTSPVEAACWPDIPEPGADEEGRELDDLLDESDDAEGALLARRTLEGFKSRCTMPC